VLESPGYRQDIAPRWADAARLRLRLRLRLRWVELEAGSAGVQDVAGLDGIALHEDFAVTQEVDQFNHAGSDRGDDDPVGAEEVAAGGYRVDSTAGAAAEFA
jgi:hypothetical protein